jgi:hypothetical protein
VQWRQYLLAPADRERLSRKLCIKIDSRNINWNRSNEVVLFPQNVVKIFAFTALKINITLIVQNLLMAFANFVYLNPVLKNPFNDKN